MRSIQPYKRGFTLIEALISITLLVSVISVSVTALAFMLRNDRIVSTQIELDLDARQLIDRMRYDLWHTSQEHILLHPPGTGNYTAVSFPIIYDAGPVNIDTNGSIVWDATVIYHFWTGEVFEVRRTVTPFLADKDLRQDELAEVSESGEGSGTNGSTRVLISNLVEWDMNVTAAQIDTYARSNSFATISLGSARLDPGVHEITFTAVGKNKASIGSARNMGIDYLNLTPSALALEGEWMPVVASSGPAVTFQNMGTNESWGGNARLWFPATANNNTFTLEFLNDAWEERNFLTTGDRKQSVERFMTTRSGINTFGLRLEGNGEAWSATNQTRDVSASDAEFTTNTQVRVILRGNNATNDGGWISFSGTNVWAVFSSKDDTTISGAFIGECNPNAATPYALTGSSNALTFGSGASSITFDGSVTSRPLAYAIDKTKSYALGFTVAAGGKVSAWEQAQGDVSAYVSTNGFATGTASELLALDKVRTGHASEGMYTSGVIDSQERNQTFSSIDWSETIPTGASIQFHVRAANDATLTNATWISAVKGGQPAVQGRYVQFRATLRPAVNTTTRVTTSPELFGVILEWDGPSRFVDMEGKFAVGPQMGIYEVEVDGSPLLQGIQVKLAVKKDLVMGIGQPREVTATAYAEIVPRN